MPSSDLILSTINALCSCCCFAGYTEDASGKMSVSSKHDRSVWVVGSNRLVCWG